ncbi:MAG: hypothetical protein ACI9GZ_001905, partial [Bacteroidia bacterium]
MKIWCQHFGLVKFIQEFGSEHLGHGFDRKQI